MGYAGPGGVTPKNATPERGVGYAGPGGATPKNATPERRYPPACDPATVARWYGTLAPMAATRTAHRSAAPLVVAGLFAMALLLRCWALGWGLPYVEHPDEPAVLEPAVRMVQRGDPNPGIFLYPSLHYYMLAPIVRLYGAWGIAQGRYSSLADLPARTYLFTTAPELYRWSRALTALLGALSVAALYLLGRRMFDGRVALLAALALALSAYHVQHSHYITTDVPTGLWVSLALLGAWGVAQHGRWRDYLLAAVATGLAAGTKYNAGVVGLALAVAAAIFVVDTWRAGGPAAAGRGGDEPSCTLPPARRLKPRATVTKAAAAAFAIVAGAFRLPAARRAPALAGTYVTPAGWLAMTHGGRLLVAALLAVAVFLLTTPFALLDFAAFRRGMLINADHYASGSHGDFIGRWRLDGYLAFFWHDGLMPTGALLLLAGLPLLVRRTPRQLAILGTAVLVSTGLLLTQAVNFTRNTLPIVPALFLLTAAATLYLGEWLGAQLARLSGVRGPQIIDLRPDGAPSTAEVHRAAVARRAGALASVLLAALLLAPQLFGTTWLLRYWSRPHTLVAAAETLRVQPRGMLAAVEAHPVQWAGDPAVTPLRWLGTYPPDWYRARGYRYVLVNHERYDPADQAAYERLFTGATVLLALPDRSLGLQPGPGGALLDLGEHPELIPFVRRPARFGDSVALLGYELAPGEPRSRITPLEGADAHELAPGAPLQINLYWHALAPMARDYSLFVHVYDAAGQRVAQRDLPLRYGDYPTSRWQPGELVIDRADMPLPALSPGTYRLLIGLYDAETGATLPTEDGAPVELTTLTVRS